MSQAVVLTNSSCYSHIKHAFTISKQIHRLSPKPQANAGWLICFFLSNIFSSWNPMALASTSRGTMKRCLGVTGTIRLLNSCHSSCFQIGLYCNSLLKCSSLQIILWWQLQGSLMLTGNCAFTMYLEGTRLHEPGLHTLNWRNCLDLLVHLISFINFGVLNSHQPYPAWPMTRNFGSSSSKSRVGIRLPTNLIHRGVKNFWWQVWRWKWSSTPFYMYMLKRGKVSIT